MSDEKQNLKTELSEGEESNDKATQADEQNTDDNTVKLSQHIKQPETTTVKETTTMGTTNEEESQSEKEETEPKDPIAELKQENADLKDKMLRLTADMENLRRRTEREKQDIGKYAIANFARDLLTVDDNFQRTLKAIPEELDEENAALKSLIDGVEMTGREMINVFERYGIKKINPAGQIFDPNTHQAMFELDNPNVPIGTVIEVVATGYMIGERVLRPAMVGIAKGGEKPVKKETEKPDEKAKNAEKNSDQPEEKPEVDKSV